MPELHDRALGTPPDRRIAYALHQTGSRLVGDRFLASYLVDCLNMVDGLGSVHKLLLAAEGKKRGETAERIGVVLAQAEDNIRWVAEMKAEDFHRTNVLAFLSFWAAHEAGHENIIAAILGTVQSAAAAAVGQFRPGRFDIASWPWSNAMCLEVAQKLDQRAKDRTPDGGWDAAARLTTLYAWLGVSLSIPSSVSEKFNETSMVRNVLLHRYGRMAPSDISRVPHLAEYRNTAIQLTRARLADYYQAVVGIHLAVTNGISATGWE